MKRADPCLQTMAAGRISIVFCRTDTCLQTVERPVPAECPCPLRLWVNRHKRAGEKPAEGCWGRLLFGVECLLLGSIASLVGELDTKA